MCWTTNLSWSFWRSTSLSAVATFSLMGGEKSAVALLQSVQILKIYISQGSVVTRFRCAEIFIDYLLQILKRVCHWKNFENWSMFDKGMTKTQLHIFLTHDVVNSKISLYLLFYFYRASAQLARQSHVLATIGMSVCLSHPGIASKWRKLGSQNLHGRIAQGL